MASAATPAARTRTRSRPKAKAKASQPHTIQWQKVGRLALLFVLFVILLLYIRPVTHWVQQRETAAHSRADLQALQQEHKRLNERLEQLSGPGAVEREARRMGMVRPGERPFVIEHPQQPQTP